MLMFPSSQQEAHKMVREANVKRAAAEKQLKEAQGKVCGLVCWGFLLQQVMIDGYCDPLPH